MSTARNLVAAAAAFGGIVTAAAPAAADWTVECRKPPATEWSTVASGRDPKPLVAQITEPLARSRSKDGECKITTTCGSPTYYKKGQKTRGPQPCR